MFRVSKINGQVVPDDVNIRIDIPADPEVLAQGLEARIQAAIEAVERAMPRVPGQVPGAPHPMWNPIERLDMLRAPSRAPSEDSWVDEEDEEALPDMPDIRAVLRELDAERLADNPYDERFIRPQHPLAQANDALTAHRVGRWLLPEAMARRQDAVGGDFVQHCHEAGIRGDRAWDLVQDLHNVHALPRSRHSAYTQHERTQALTALLETCEMTVVRDPAQIIAEARRMPWPRLIHFSGDEVMGAFEDTAITGALGYATYQVGAQAGRTAVAAKAAGITLKGAAMATGASMMGAATGVGATITGVEVARRVRRHYQTVQAFRDVWDHAFSRDAFLVHRIRDHVVAHGEAGDIDKECRHGDNPWTAPFSRRRTTRRAYQGQPAQVPVHP
jgi:hypothetical protein